MNKKHYGILILATIAGLSYATYLLYRNNRKRYAEIIRAGGASTQAVVWLVTLQEAYLKQWARAVKTQQKIFTYNGKNYSTAGGAAMK